MTIKIGQWYRVIGGSFFKKNDVWKWLCPDGMETTDLYFFLEVETGGAFLVWQFEWSMDK